MSDKPIRLTQYSHGAGCGCKIAPDVLTTILEGSVAVEGATQFPSLLVGNHSRDDAAAVDIGDGRAILSTTDFFMPIVDDPFDFGRVAATNAISDIYAMGGTPLMAVAILGWPINILAPDIAGQVIAGGRAVCTEVGIPLAGGHSIDAPEPIFGLAVTGELPIDRLKRNSTAQSGDLLYLTKPLGIGILTTAEKQGKLESDHRGIATATMCQTNRIGADLAAIQGVNAITDVTGFALAGHLLELCDAADLYAEIEFNALTLLPGIEGYIAAGCIPGGSQRNFAAFGQHINAISDLKRHVVCDPQTSGGLLISVSCESSEEVEACLATAGLPTSPIGCLRKDVSPTRIHIG